MIAVKGRDVRIVETVLFVTRCGPRNALHTGAGRDVARGRHPRPSRTIVAEPVDIVVRIPAARHTPIEQDTAAAAQDAILFSSDKDVDLLSLLKQLQHPRIEAVHRQSRCLKVSISKLVQTIRSHDDLVTAYLRDGATRVDASGTYRRSDAPFTRGVRVQQHPFQQAVKPRRNCAMSILRRKRRTRLKTDL